MPWRNTPQLFGAVAKGFHWVVAILVLILLAVGLYMEELDPTPLKFKLSFWHKSFGIMVLALVSARLLWRLTNIYPSSIPTHRKWEKMIAQVIHGMMYACLFAMPLTGWMMSSAKGFGVSVFGWFTLPDLIGENKELGGVLREAHEYIAWTLIACVGLHLAGALKHHFIDRDITLRRMLPFAKVSLALLFFAVAPASARADSLPQWTIDPAQSHLTFEATQMKAPFTGEFKKFGGTIAFDPAHPESGTAAITIDMASVDTKSSDRDANLPTSPWFFTESFPESRFEVASFEKTGDNTYIAHGKLTIREVTLPLDLPFTLDLTEGGKTAHVKGETALQRLDYNVGTGDWKDTATVGNSVTVKIDLTAHRVAAAQ